MTEHDPTAGANAESLTYDEIVEGLAEHGYWVGRQLFPHTLAQSLHLEAIDQGQAGYRPAGIGRADNHRMDSSTRSDQIRWIDETQGGANATFLQWMEGLRKSVNQTLFLGLFDYEAHFARYETGAYYKRHLDAFKGRSNRMLSTVLYLNPDWPESNGGELLIYPDTDSRDPMLSVLPRLGTLVVFLSTEFPHEVLPGRSTRHSIAGWFRRKDLL